MSKKVEKTSVAAAQADANEAETKPPTLEERITRLENIVKIAFGVSI